MTSFIQFRRKNKVWELIPRSSIEILIKLALKEEVEAIMASDLTLEESELFVKEGLALIPEEVRIGLKRYLILRVKKD